MRSCAVILLLPALAAADPEVRARHLTEADSEPQLHLDPTMFDESIGGVGGGQRALWQVGPRARVAAEGNWWGTALSPTIFAEDTTLNSWRANLELSYDLGPFKIGMNAQLGKEGELTHRMVGLFAYRTFRLSRWMHAWIVLGASYDQWNREGEPTLTGGRIGISIGTTFK